MLLTKRVQKIKPSPTLAISAKAKMMKAKGIDVIGFGAGEPDFDTPENIKRAAIKAIEEGFTKYTAVGGIDELKEAIIEKFKKDNDLEYSKAQITVSCGAKHTLYNIAQSLFEEGEEVLIPAPYWVSYPDQIILAGAAPVIVETSEENGFKLSKDLLKNYISPRTKALILNTPSNPTGIAYQREELEELAEILLENNILVISDEIYEKIIYDGFKHTSIASLDKALKEQTIVVNGVSKEYSMTGWRIGYAAAPEEIIKAMNKIQGQSTSNPNSIAQKASVEAILGSQAEVKKMVGEFDKRRQYMVDRLNSIPGVSCLKPLGAFYAFPNLSSYFGRSYKGKTINGSTDLTSFVLDEFKVAVVPGEAFGADNHVRLSYATSMKNIEEGLDRIEEALSKLE